MKKQFRLVCALLALMMLASCFAGCANTGGGNSTTQGGVSTTPTSGGGTLSSDVHDVPQLDFDGEIIMIYSRAEEFLNDDICVEADLGDKISKAVWERQATVENYLNVSLRNAVTYTMESIGDDIRAIRDAGRNDYSIVSDGLYRCGKDISENLFLDMSGMQYLDLSKDYWSQLINDSATYKGKQFFVAGAISISLYRLTYVTFFNETMFKNKGYDDPYAWVDTGEWTIAKQYELAEQFYDDSTGDVAGEKDAGDTYGLLTDRGILLDPYLASCEISWLKKSNDDSFYLTFDTKKAANVCEAVGKLYYTNKGVYYYERFRDLNVLAEKFGQGSAAMTTLRLFEAESSYISSVTFGLGVLPVPKYEEGVGTYYGTVHDTVATFAIPNLEGKTDEEMQMLGAVLEVMASEGGNKVVPAYYDITLKDRTLAQTKPIEMTDRIVKNVIVDPGMIYSLHISGGADDGMSAPHQFLRDVIGTGENRYKTAQRRLDVLYNKTSGYVADLNEMLDGIDGKLSE